MGGSFRIEVQKNNLPQLPARTRRKLADALREIGAQVESRAKELVPVDTGELRDSIRAEGGLWRGAGDSRPAEVEVVATAPHATFIELGTVKAPAQPFLAPAVESVRGEFQDAIARAVEEGAR